MEINGLGSVVPYKPFDTKVRKFEIDFSDAAQQYSNLNPLITLKNQYGQPLGVLKDSDSYWVPDTVESLVKNTLGKNIDFPA